MLTMELLDFLLDLLLVLEHVGGLHIEDDVLGKLIVGAL